ncbi:MAG: 30S ribosomal protein S16 [bacterium]|nr:30S ribosomal protein S16 [bacterium]
MLTIRLSRTGKTKQATYRFVISEKTKDPWGDSLEILGNFNPRTNPATVNLKKERIAYWISKGAQTSDTVHNLLVDHGVIKGEKVKTVRRKKVIAEEKKPEAPKAEPKVEAKPEPAEKS